MQISYTWLDKWVTPVVTVVDDVGKAKLERKKKRQLRVCYTDESQFKKVALFL